MKTTQITSFALALALGLALPALAQETATGTTAPKTVEGAPATDTGLSMGAEVGSPPAVGDTYVAAKFDDWEQRCIKTETGADPCQLYQLLKDGNGNSVAEFSVFSLPEGSKGPAVAGATFIAPLETLLATGLTLQIDTNKQRAYPFTFCATLGCVARIGFSAEEVAMFKKGAVAEMTIVPFVAPDQKVSVKASLKGFTAGLDAVTAANKVADAAAREAGAAPAAPAAPEPAPAEAAPSGN